MSGTRFVKTFLLLAGFLHEKSRFLENLKTENTEKRARRKNVKFHVKIQISIMDLDIYMKFREYW